MKCTPCKEYRHRPDVRTAKPSCVGVREGGRESRTTCSAKQVLRVRDSHVSGRIPPEAREFGQDLERHADPPGTGSQSPSAGESTARPRVRRDGREGRSLTARDSPGACSGVRPGDVSLEEGLLSPVFVTVLVSIGLPTTLRSGMRDVVDLGEGTPTCEADARLSVRVYLPWSLWMCRGPLRS